MAVTHTDHLAAYLSDMQRRLVVDSATSEQIYAVMRSNQFCEPDACLLVLGRMPGPYRIDPRLKAEFN